MECKHFYEHLGTIKKASEIDKKYTRIDRFYCRRCLDIKEIIIKDDKPYGQNPTPDWY
jgi:hypothetical protein